MSSRRRLWVPGLALLLGAFSLTAPPRSMIVTVPAAEARQTLYPETEAVDWVRANLVGGRLLGLDSLHHYLHGRRHPEFQNNRTSLHGLPKVRGYDPMITAAYARFLNATSGLELDTPAHGRLLVPRVVHWGLLRMLNVTVVASLRPVGDPELQLIWEGPDDIRIYAVSGKHTGARWVPGHAVASEDPEFNLLCVAGLQPRSFDPDRQVLLPMSAQFPLEDPQAPSSGTVTVVERGFDRVTYEVDASAPGFLVTDVPFDPGWRARVGALPEEVLEGNTLFATVWVPPGPQRVELRHRPLSLLRGALLSLAGLLLALLLCLPRRAPVAPAAAQETAPSARVDEGGSEKDSEKRSVESSGAS